jgi:hypothetical protein
MSADGIAKHPTPVSPLCACRLSRTLAGALLWSTPGTRARLLWDLELEHGRGFAFYVRNLVIVHEELEEEIAAAVAIERGVDQAIAELELA